MSPDILFALPGNEILARSLATRLNAAYGHLTTRKFPDGETYLRFETDVEKKHIAMVCTLNAPDAKLVSLMLVADGARQLNASTIGLVAPYLAYMRQDKRFHAGETITSRAVAGMLSQRFHWLVTVDPHLHRYRSLSEIYSIPSRVVHAAPAISEWIRANVARPVLVGPDEESAQWVSDAAQKLAAPFITLKKNRQADRTVTLEPIDMSKIGDKTPVLVDDIIASGETMIEAVRMLGTQAVSRPVCLAIHGVFADGADSRLASLGAEVVATNTIPGAAAHISLDDLIANGIRAL